MPIQKKEQGHMQKMEESVKKANDVNKRDIAIQKKAKKRKQ